MDVHPPYELPDLSWLERDGSPLPAGVLWGVANAGFQVEGGYNGPGEPENNWAAWERAGRVERADQAVRFWSEWPRHLDLAAGLGLSAFRLSLEWARLQPKPGADLDADAVAGYADILAGCRVRGLEPVVTLLHFTHPSWLGPDPWLDAGGPGAFRRFAERAVRALGRALVERGAEPVRWWITINEPNILALSTYLVGDYPHGARRGPERFRRALDQLLVAHVAAYRSIHAVHEQEGWAEPTVAFNDYTVTCHPLDRGLLDVAVARAAGVPRNALAARLSEDRARFEASAAPLVEGAAGRSDRLLARFVLPDVPAALPGYVNALYAGDGAAHDFVGIDYYVAPLTDYLRPPLGARRRGRAVPALAQLWETTIRPDGLRVLLGANVHPEHRVPILVAENGMATRARGGLNLPRPDGWRRPSFLRAHVAELLWAARAGAPVAGYLHWTLVDNYEWGSYEPRFGLYGVDRRRGPTILSLDADGQDAAGTYRRIVTALRSGDGRAARAALEATPPDRATSRGDTSQ